MEDFAEVEALVEGIKTFDEQRNYNASRRDAHDENVTDNVIGDWWKIFLAPDWVECSFWWKSTGLKFIRGYSSRLKAVW